MVVKALFFSHPFVVATAVIGKLARVVLFLPTFPTSLPPLSLSSPSLSLSLSLTFHLPWPKGAQPAVCFSTHSAWHVHVWWLARLPPALIYFPPSSLQTTNNIYAKHIEFTCYSPFLSFQFPSPSMYLGLEILDPSLFVFELFFFSLSWSLFGIFIFDCMHVWNSFLFSLALFAFFLFLSTFWAPGIMAWCVRAQCVHALCFLSTSSLLLSLSLVSVWFELFYFHLFWFLPIYVLVNLWNTIFI